VPRADIAPGQGGGWAKRAVVGQSGMAERDTRQSGIAKGTDQGGIA
jgi:hypothetical protein